MGRRLILFFALALLLGTTLFFSCGQPGNSTNSNTPYTVSGFSYPVSAPQILQTLCNKLIQAHPGLSESVCINGVNSASFSGALGVSLGSLDPFSQLLAYDQAGKIIGNAGPLGVCLADIMALDPASPAVKNAYLPSAHHPFEFLIDMIPQGAGSCDGIYPDILPQITPRAGPTPLGLTTLNFDTPEPDGPPDSAVAVYGGIDFMNQWRWQGPYNADSGDSLYFASDAAPGSGQMNLPSGTTLVSLDVFNGDLNGNSGKITITEAGGNNPVVTVDIPADGQMHPIETGWTKPVTNPVTVTFSDGTGAGWVLGVDDIQYK